MKALKVDLLWFGQSDPIRNLKTAGIICIFFQQHLHVHPAAKIVIRQ
jgi:hypothetical protein